MNPISTFFQFCKKRVPLLISFLVCAGTFAGMLLLACDNTTNQQPGQAFIDSTYGGFLDSRPGSLPPGYSNLKIDPDKPEEVKKLIAQIYSSRVSAYQATSGKLSNLLFTLAILTLVGIFILFFKPKELEIPVIKLALPDKLFFIVLPAVILYLWIQMGLLMNASIDSRLVLERMTDSMETIGNDRVSYYHSNARTLVDQGFVDTWCTYYYDVFEGGRNGDRHRDNAAAVLFVFYGIFWGLTLATSFCLITVYYETYKNMALSVILVCISGFMFSGWTINMVAWYPHSGALAACMWGVALLALVLWNVFGKKYAEKMASKRGRNEHGNALPRPDQAQER